MRLGLALPQYDFSVAGESPLRWQTVRAYAETAEGLGFSSLWLADHLFLSVEKYGGPARDYAGFHRRCCNLRIGTHICFINSSIARFASSIGWGSDGGSLSSSSNGY